MSEALFTFAPPAGEMTQALARRLEADPSLEERWPVAVSQAKQLARMLDRAEAGGQVAMVAQLAKTYQACLVGLGLAGAPPAARGAGPSGEEGSSGGRRGILTSVGTPTLGDTA